MGILSSTHILDSDSICFNISSLDMYCRRLTIKETQRFFESTFILSDFNASGTNAAKSKSVYYLGGIHSFDHPNGVFVVNNNHHEQHIYLVYKTGGSFSRIRLSTNRSGIDEVWSSISSNQVFRETQRFYIVSDSLVLKEHLMERVLLETKKLRKSC